MVVIKNNMVELREYLTIFQKEMYKLKEDNYYIKTIVIEKIASQVSVKIYTSGRKFDDKNNVLLNHKYTLLRGYVKDTFFYYRSIVDILDEKRINGLKELINSG